MSSVTGIDMGFYHMNKCVGGMQGPAVPLTREQKLERAVREIRELIGPWGDGDHARLIRAVLDRNLA